MAVANPISLPPSFSGARIDPYKNFKFRIKINGQYVLGCQKVSAIKRTTETVDWRDGSDASNVRKLTGRTSHAPITCEQGLSQDNALETYANLVFNGSSMPADPTALGNNGFRLNITIELYDESNFKQMAYNLHNAWISEYQAWGDFDANAHAVQVRSVKIEYEWFDRDAGTTETEPT